MHNLRNYNLSKWSSSAASLSILRLSGVKVFKQSLILNHSYKKYLLRCCVSGLMIFTDLDVKYIFHSSAVFSQFCFDPSGSLPGSIDNRS